MPKVVFRYKNGREKEMSDRYAVVLEKIGHGSYMTRDMRAVMPVVHIASPVEQQVELDDNGVPFDPELHAESKVKNKDGSWRKKPGSKAAD